MPTPPTQEDAIYAKAQPHLVDFEFNEAVVNVFPDMIRRSVPGYSTLIPLIALLAEQYALPDSRCYDLGCSLGAATLAMRHRIRQSGVEIVAVDNSAAMIERAHDNIDADIASVPVELICGDINEVEISNASVVVLNFTLQFIDPSERLVLLEKIYQGLRPGGVLLLSEKLKFDDDEEQTLLTDLHHAFKRANGYSDMEIAQKRTALENVLIPDTVEQHQARLAEAGFASYRLWFQCLNFASLLAIK